MSWNLYLIDKKENIALKAGKVDKDEFLEDLKIYEKLRDIMFESLTLDLNEIKIKNMSLKTIKELIDIYDLVQQLSFMNSSILALEYAFLNKDRLNEFVFSTELPENIKLI